MRLGEETTTAVEMTHGIAYVTWASNKKNKISRVAMFDYKISKHVSNSIYHWWSHELRSNALSGNPMFKLEMIQDSFHHCTRACDKCSSNEKHCNPATLHSETCEWWNYKRNYAILNIITTKMVSFNSFYQSMSIMIHYSVRFSPMHKIFINIPIEQ